MQGGEEEGTGLSATALYDYQAGKWAATLVSRKLLVYIDQRAPKTICSAYSHNVVAYMK